MHPVLYFANTKEEVRHALANMTIEEQHILVKDTIELLDSEIEKVLVAELNDLTIMMMSQVVMLEDELLILERIMLSEGVMV